MIPMSTFAGIREKVVGKKIGWDFPGSFICSGIIYAFLYDLHTFELRNTFRSTRIKILMLRLEEGRISLKPTP